VIRITSMHGILSSVFVHTSPHWAWWERECARRWGGLNVRAYMAGGMIVDLAHRYQVSRRSEEC
jgi:hypothetical protein